MSETTARVTYTEDGDTFIYDALFTDDIEEGMVREIYGDTETGAGYNITDIKLMEGDQARFNHDKQLNPEDN